MLQIQGVKLVASASPTRETGKLRKLVRKAAGWQGVVMVTSYEGLKSLKRLLLSYDWDYCVLDEGQRIRNPDAEVRTS